MIKLPEPAGRIAAELGNTNHIRTIPYYTESQLKQAVRDVLEEVKTIVVNVDMRTDDHEVGTVIYARIDALIKEI